METSWRNAIAGVAVIVVFVAVYMMMGGGGKDNFSGGGLDDFGWDIYWSSDLSCREGNNHSIQTFLDNFVAKRPLWKIRDMTPGQLDREFEYYKIRSNTWFAIQKNIEREVLLPIREISPGKLEYLYRRTFKRNLEMALTSAKIAIRGRKGVWIPWTATALGDHNLDNLANAVQTFRSKSFVDRIGLYNMATGKLLRSRDADYDSIKDYLFLSK